MNIEPPNGDPTNNIEEENEQLLNIQVSQTTAEKLKRQALDAHQLFTKFQETFYTENADVYYILSKKWLDQWKKYTSYNELVAKKQPTQYFGKIQLPILNEDLIDKNVTACFKYSPLKEHFWNVWMREDVSENQDYIIVNKEIWSFFSNLYHPSHQIGRQSNGEGQQRMVAVKLLRFQTLLLYPSIVSGISQGMGYRTQFEDEQLQVDRNYTLKEYYSLIQKTVPTFKGDYARDNGVRLWRYQATTPDPLKTLYNEIKKQTQDFDYNDDMVFDFGGEYLDPNKYNTIEDIGIIPTDVIIVEFKQSSRPWCIKNTAVEVEGKCESCYQIKVLKFPCICRKVAYCCEDCKKNDEKFHSNRCEKVGSDDETIRAMQLGPNSVKGIVGLGNLGNTCFMNSGLQCLSNTYALTQYFLNNKFFDEINEDNPLGTKGQLVKKFASLMKKLWCGDKSVVVPTNFKIAVGKFQPMFKGYHQHDSSELITFLLDGIHEDLNRVKKKPYVESKDSFGRPDFEVAKESWTNHTARNQSIIVDLMYGQYKSKLKCPKCELVSITFDPYLIVQLGIPNQKKKFIQIKLFSSLVNNKSKSIPYDKNLNLKVADFKVRLGQEFDGDNLNTDNLILYIPTTYQQYEPLANEKPMNDVRKQCKRTGLCARQLTQHEVAIPKEERVFLPFQNKAIEGYGYKRHLYQNGILCFGTTNTLKQVHIQVFKMLLFLFSEQLENVDVNDEKALQEFYDEKINKKYYSLEFKSNSSFWQACSFCSKKTCQDCPVMYDDETVEEVKKRVVKVDQNCSVEFGIVWSTSPLKNVKVFDIFDHYIKNNSMAEESTNNDHNQVRNNNMMQQQNTKPVTLQECLEFSQLPEQLAEDNAWYCKNCQEHVQAWKSMQLYKAPKILMFNLKRFKASNRMFKSKLETFVDFPVNGLDMTDFVHNSCTPNEYQNETDANNGESNKQKLIYDLFAISNHFGGLGGGHYTAYAKNQFTQQWYNFDDSHASQVSSEDSIITKAAYVLCYQLRESDPDNSKSNQL